MVGLCRQLDSGEDGAPVAGRVLFDALAVDGHEDLIAAAVEIVPRRFGVQTPSSRRRG